MPFDPVVNFGYTTVAVAPSPADSGLTLEVTDPSVFPDPNGVAPLAGPFNVLVWDAANGLPLVSNAEWVRVTAEAAGVYTIERTQEDTPVARSIVVGDQVALPLSAATIRLMQAGGGFQIGSSYLKATNPGDDNLGSVNVILDWTLDSVAGADIEIDGGDATKINILTTGSYTWSYRADVYPNSGGLNRVFQEVHLNSAVTGLIQDDGILLDGDLILDRETTMSMPAYPLEAGDFLSFRLLGTSVGVPDWGYFNVELAVTRLS